MKRKSKKRCLFGLAAALALASGAAVAADKQHAVWQGTLGSQPIVVEQTLGSAEGKPICGGRYFYRRHRLDISLDGQGAANGACTLEEMPLRWSRDEAKPVWRMRAAGADRWEGEWIGTNGRKLPIRLTRVVNLPAAAEPSLSALRDDFDPYAYLRLSALKLQRGKRETVSGYGLQWLKQADSGLALFEVASGYPQPARNVINRTLHRRLWRWVEDEHQCRSGVSPGQAGFGPVKVTVRHIDTQVLSASVFTAYDCGGAHPDMGDAPLNIDTGNGRELRLEDVLWLGQGAPVHENREDEKKDQAWMRYRNDVLAPWVVRQLSRLYPAQMAAPKSADDCNYRDPDVWNFPAWYVTPKGIHLAAYFARVQRVCDDPDWAVLPWSLVDAHRGPVRLH